MSEITITFCRNYPKLKSFERKVYRIYMAITRVATWTPSSNTFPLTMPQEGAGDSDGSSEFKDDQRDMSLDIDSLQQGHISQSRSLGQK